LMLVPPTSITRTLRDLAERSVPTENLLNKEAKVRIPGSTQGKFT
jgi:hypothetical protein